MKRKNAITRRRNPTALAVARQDPLGRVAVPMLATAAGATVGLLAARPLDKSPMVGGITGAIVGLVAYFAIDQLDQRR